MKSRNQILLESKIRKMVREELSAFAKGAPESQYTVEDCIEEIKYNVDMPNPDFGQIIYFAELALKLKS